MDIRQLEQIDAKLFLEIRLKALQEYPEAFASSYEEEYYKTVEDVVNYFNPENQFILGLMDNSSLAGIIGFIREKHIKTKHKGFFWGMYVIPEYRGKGYGKKLILEAINKATNTEGLEQINLSVVSSNKIAMNLYKSVGFKKYGLEKRALIVGSTYFDEILMSKSLYCFRKNLK